MKRLNLRAEMVVSFDLLVLFDSDIKIYDKVDGDVLVYRYRQETVLTCV